MKHPLRTLALLPAAPLLVAAAPAPEASLVDLSGYAEQLERLASEQLGRRVEIGTVAIEPALTPLIRARDVRVANAEWGTAPYLARIEEVRVQVELLDLLDGDVAVPELTLIGPRFALERNEAGEANWTFGKPDATTDDPPLVPTIGALRIERADLTFHDRAADIDLAGSLASATGRMTDEEVTLDANGSLAGEPLRLSFDGGSVPALRAGDEPYPLNAELRLGGTRLAAEGSVVAPFGQAALDLDVHAAGPTLATLGLGEFPLPDSRPYSLDGHLSGDGGTWRLGDIAASLGDSRAAGWAQVALAGGRPMIRADLLTRDLRYRDLVPAASEPTEGQAQVAAGPLFPQVPVPTDWLHLADAIVHLRAERPELPGPPVELLDVRLTVRDGRLEASPLELQVAGGKITGELALNGRGPIPSADADLAYEGIRLKRAFRGTRFADETAGTLRGQLYLLGTGETVADLADSLRGRAAAVMDDGTLSGLLIEAVGLDVAEALALYIGDDARVPVRCGVAGLDVRSGVAEIRPLVIDTKDSVIRGQGSVDLGAETIDLRLEAQGKDFSPLDPDAPVFVQGDLRAPGIAVGGRVVIPQLELGLQGNAPCGRLIEKVMTPGEDAARG